MSWKCVLKECGLNRYWPDIVEIGTMWLAPYHLLGDRAKRLSPNYHSQWAGKRAPLVVCLPNNTFFCVDNMATDGGNGWTVTGEAPLITVSPSINIVGSYHGWIKNGVISDDCEGRVFDGEGRQKS